MLSIKRRIHLLVIIIISFTIIGMFSFHFFDYWNVIVENEYKKTKSIAILLDTQLEGTYEDLLADTSTLNKREKVRLLNKKLQPVINNVTKSFPEYGSGYYSKKLQSIVAFGPNFEAGELLDIQANSPARIVYKTKKSYQFKAYSQTRNSQVVGIYHPVIRHGEVIGVTWANIALTDVFELFWVQVKKRLILVIFILLIAYFGTIYITRQYEKGLSIFRNRVHKLDISEEEKRVFSPELMAVYNEVVKAKEMVVDNERKYQRDITEKILRAQEQERKRLSRELHDGVGQLLYSILVTLKLVENAKKECRIEEQINVIEDLTNSSIEEIKRIALHLRPSSLDDLGLISSIRSLVERYENTFQIKVDFKIVNFSRRLEPELETTLYRICQEGLTNIAKYAETNKAFITIELAKDEIQLEIADRGKGFNTIEVASGENNGLGLYGMKERTKLFNGIFRVSSKPGEGTAISVRIPI
ncbi:histidine kinase [Metabacillus fastidiosus]|uniref:histidine kinase n=1 Tax=Metabacillus fastidiosus TaxID=1458 RepID=UPI002E1F5DB4|nr:histidine kinase [Metabacillus fastidiosus]MED4454104.1 histidine kinase [Metabacillus fastidiosus]